MTETALIYALMGHGLFGLGLFALITARDALARIMAVNLLGTGASSVLLCIAWRGEGSAADPVPHAFVLTGIVVAVATTALALAILRRLEGLPPIETPPESTP